MPEVAVLAGSRLAGEALCWALVRERDVAAVWFPELALLLAHASRHPPDLVLLAGDDDDDEEARFAAVQSLRRAAPETKLVLLAAEVGPALLRCATRFEVQGVVLTSEVPRDLVSAVRHVLGGRSTFPEGWSWTSVAGAADVLAGLRPREREVLELLSSGLRNDEIAERLFLSVNTVKFHVRAIYARLGVRNRVQAARLLDGA